METKNGIRYIDDPDSSYSAFISINNFWDYVHSKTCDDICLLLKQMHIKNIRESMYINSKVYDNVFLYKSDIFISNIELHLYILDLCNNNNISNSMKKEIINLDVAIDNPHTFDRDDRFIDMYKNKYSIAGIMLNERAD